MSSRWMFVSTIITVAASSSKFLTITGYLTKPLVTSQLIETLDKLFE